MLGGQPDAATETSVPRRAQPEEGSGRCWQPRTFTGGSAGGAQPQAPGGPSSKSDVRLQLVCRRVQQWQSGPFGATERLFRRQRAGPRACGQRRSCFIRRATVARGPVGTWRRAAEDPNAFQTLQQQCSSAALHTIASRGGAADTPGFTQRLPLSMHLTTTVSEPRPLLALAVASTESERLGTSNTECRGGFAEATGEACSYCQGPSVVTVTPSRWGLSAFRHSPVSYLTHCARSLSRRGDSESRAHRTLCFRRCF